MERLDLEPYEYVLESYETEDGKERKELHHPLVCGECGKEIVSDAALEDLL